jgi:hypothetical protein
MQIHLTQLKDLQWFESSLSWFGANDARLCQNGGIQFETTWYHNWFGVILSRFKRATSSCPHKIWQGRTNPKCLNPKLEGLIWDSQGTIE